MSTFGKTFCETFHGRAGRFLRALNAGDPESPEVIHRLRVDIKAIRALLDLLDFMLRGKSRTKKLRAILSPLFRAAGSVRTVQVNLSLLRSQGAAKARGFERELRQSECSSRAELLDIARSFDREKFRRLADEVAGIIGGLERERVRIFTLKFISTRYELVSTTLRKVRTARDLHDVRKTIKVVRTLLRLMSGPGIRKTSGIETRIVGTIDRTLGGWHDRVIFCRDLRRHAGNRTGSAATEEERKLAAGLRRSVREGLPTVRRDTGRRMEALRLAAKLNR